MELKCKVQHYEWGKLGSESMVAKLLKSADESVTIEEDKPYAELWLGTHPNGPSLLIERDILLSDYLKDNEDAVGPLVKKNYGVQVPFLLKVLSVRKALSIQAHPDKKLAERLHQQFPHLYKDDNHKPELAVALTPFEVLCGFRYISEIKDFLNKVPEFRGLLPAQSVAALEGACLQEGEGEGALIRPLFEGLLKADKAAVSDSLNTFLQRVQKEEAEVRSSVEYEVIARLVREFAAEAGCWAPLLMNHFTLSVGDALFMEANMPHAYLAGDCVEIMANSDNVVRAGLTPKFVDVDTLVEMLEYRPRAPQDMLLTPHTRHTPTTRYTHWTPPVHDFKLTRILVRAGSTCVTPCVSSPGVGVVCGGRGTLTDTEPLEARKGTALFVKASRQLTVRADVGGDLDLYLATVNVPPPPALEDLF